LTRAEPRHYLCLQEEPMAEVLFKGNKVHTSGKLPKVGARAPDFRLTRGDLVEVSLQDFAGK